MKKPTSFNFSRSAEHGWVIHVPGCPAPLRVDQMLVDVVRQTPDEIEGFLLSVNGLPAEIADIVPPRYLTALGVGSQLRQLNVRYTKRRVQLDSAGRCEDV